MTSDFAGLAKVVAGAEGAPDICFVAVPHPLGMISRERVIKKAHDAFSKIIDLSTGWQPPSKPEEAKAVYPAERFEFDGTLAGMSKLFLNREWSLGLPFVPPTPDQVEDMLKGTTRKPEEVIGQVPPRMGTLTVELAAVNALMAGCLPDHMPVLIAAVEALLDPRVNWRGALATTGTSQTVVIVNGPAVRELRIACEQGAAGKGHHANVAIGYAINLIAYNAGGSRPPSVDKSTLGSPADIVCWVFGENEDAVPEGWKPLHVERGFRELDSVVTVLSSYPPIDQLDHWSNTPAEHMTWWKHVISPLLGVSRGAELSPIVALGPEHAELLALAGWSKADFTRALQQETRIPLSAWPADCREMIASVASNLEPISQESLMPIVLRPEQFLVVIAGGVGKHSHYFSPFSGSLPVSKLVKK